MVELVLLLVDSLLAQTFRHFITLVQARTNIMDSLLKTPTNSSIISYPSCSLAAPSLDHMTYTTHIQTVYLRTNKLPPFTESVRHWTISSTHGILPAIDPQDNATYLRALPDRIVTVSMLQRSCHLQIMTVLLLIWIYALCCRFPQARPAISRLNAISGSLLVLVVLYFAYADQLILCEAMVALAALLCGGGLDIMGMFAVLTSARQGWYLAAITLTVAYAV